MICMRIPLSFSEDDVLTLSCTIHTQHGVGRVNFIVDTGSPDTFIGGIDSRKLGLRIVYGDKPKTIYWGQTAFRLGQIRQVEVWMRKLEDDIEKPVTFRFSRFYATKDWVLSGRNPDRYDSPNILGMSFILEQGFKLVVDGKKKEAWLEKDDA